MRLWRRLMVQVDASGCQEGARWRRVVKSPAGAAIVDSGAPLPWARRTPCPLPFHAATFRSVSSQNNPHVNVIVNNILI